MFCDERHNHGLTLIAPANLPGTPGSLTISATGWKYVRIVKHMQPVFGMRRKLWRSLLKYTRDMLRTSVYVSLSEHNK